MPVNNQLSEEEIQRALGLITRELVAAGPEHCEHVAENYEAELSFAKNRLDLIILRRDAYASLARILREQKKQDS